jgi:hypothetical protein
MAYLTDNALFSGRKGGKQHIKMNNNAIFNEDDAEYAAGDFDEMF